MFPFTPDMFIHLILFIYFYLGVSFTFQFCSLLALLSLSWIYTVHEVVLGRSFIFSSCIMPKINLRCARSSLKAGLSQRSSGDSWFNDRDRWFVSCTEWSGLYSSGCLSYTILLNLNFWCDFFPVSIKSQYLDSTRPHKVSFVQLLLCCPVVLWVQLWK